MIPVFKITADNKDITSKIEHYFASLRITDSKGYESDSFEMTLADPDAEIEWPATDVKLKVWLGFKGKDLIYKGEFVVDEPEFSGPHDHWTIKARAADMNGALKAQESHSWHDVTLSGIVRWIAEKNKLKPAIAKTFDAIKVDHIDQTNESDMNFITRLAKKYDATAKVAGGALIFADAGAMKTASGDDMPKFKLHISDSDGYHFIYSGKSDYSGVAAQWHSYGKGELKQVIAGDEGNLKTIKRKFSSEVEAKHAADAEFKRLKRSKSSGDISIKMGNPELCAESELELVGWRSDVDKNWVIREVTHELSKGSGLTAHVQLEKVQTEEN